MNIKPIGERVLLKPVEKQQKTSGGIYIPEAAQEERKEGIVKGVGAFKDGSQLPINEGDHVVYGGYSSEKFELNGVELLLIDFKDIMAKIEGVTAPSQPEQSYGGQ